MFENMMSFLKKVTKKQNNTSSSRDKAKERLHLVLMQDRANVSADFLDLMRQEIIDVIKKYIEIDESAIDVRLTNKENNDGTNGAPALYANIPIINIKEEVRAKTEEKVETVSQTSTEQPTNTEQTNTEQTNTTEKEVENDIKNEKTETEKENTENNEEKKTETEQK